MVGYEGKKREACRWNKATFLGQNSIEYQCITKVRHYMINKRDSVFSFVKWKEW